MLKSELNLAKRMTRKTKDNIWGWCLASIPVIGFMIFTLAPMIISVVMSFNGFKENSYSLSSMTFVGISNFAKILTDRMFWKALLNTLLLCLSIPFEIGLGLFFANLFKKKFVGRRVLRVVFFMPNICSVVAIAYAWRYFYNYNEYGLFNQFLAIFGIAPFEWLRSETAFIPCIIVVTIWNVVGYDILLCQAALGNISNSLYEAADLDGANAFDKFFHVTVPLVTPTMFYLLLMGLIGGLQSFARIDTLNIDPYKMGPNDAGLTLVGYMVRAKNEPKTYGGLGVGAAASLLIACFITVVTMINLKVSKRWVHYND